MIAAIVTANSFHFVAYAIVPVRMNGPRSLVLITGLGKHSREQMEPVLKPVMQQWLEEAFDPPLCAAELVDNLGR